MATYFRYCTCEAVISISRTSGYESRLWIPLMITCQSCGHQWTITSI